MTGVGGGKPFGFGSVSIDVRPVTVQTAAMRYLGEAGEVPDVRRGGDRVPGAGAAAGRCERGPRSGTP